AELPPMAKPPPPEPARILKMPRRRRTRAADTAARIHAERAHNAAERELAHQRAQELHRIRANREQARADPEEPPPF
ncbi:HNH endonuclease signature motif containing protein, partial [Mycolicibacterium vaccae]